MGDWKFGDPVPLDIALDIIDRDAESVMDAIYRDIVIMLNLKHWCSVCFGVI